MNEAPKMYRQFIQRFPQLNEAWETMAEAGQKGPLDEKTHRLVKFAIACASRRSGPAHASVRKGIEIGLTREDFEQVIALLAGTLGLPAAVTAWGWLNDELGES